MWMLIKKAGAVVVLVLAVVLMLAPLFPSFNTETVPVMMSPGPGNARP